MAGQRRERVLALKDGTLLTQDDPLGHPVDELLVMIGTTEVRFRYDISVVEEDDQGRETIVAWYLEEAEDDR
jgi:hypothetical protein